MITIREAIDELEELAAQHGDDAVLKYGIVGVLVEGERTEVDTELGGASEPRVVPGVCESCRVQEAVFSEFGGHYCAGCHAAIAAARRPA